MNSAEQHYELPAHRRLTRSPHGMIAGVCAGLSDCFGVNLIFARIVFIILGLANGLGIVVYLILALLIPVSPPAEAPGPALTCRPRSSGKTFFAYIAGVTSICTALLTFVNNVSYIIVRAEKLLGMVQAGSIPVDSGQGGSDWRDSAASAATSNEALYPSQEVSAVSGSTRVIWRAGGVRYEGDVKMTGVLGIASVVYRDPGTLAMLKVYQNVALEYKGQELCLVGFGPSRSDYSPDMFRLVLDGDRYLKIVEACDIQGCIHVDSTQGQLQVSSRSDRS